MCAPNGTIGGGGRRQCCGTKGGGSVHEGKERGGMNDSYVQKQRYADRRPSHCARLIRRSGMATTRGHSKPFFFPFGTNSNNLRWAKVLPLGTSARAAAARRVGPRRDRVIASRTVDYSSNYGKAKSE